MNDKLVTTPEKPAGLFVLHRRLKAPPTIGKSRDREAPRTGPANRRASDGDSQTARRHQNYSVWRIEKELREIKKAVDRVEKNLSDISQKTPEDIVVVGFAGYVH